MPKNRLRARPAPIRRPVATYEETPDFNWQGTGVGGDWGGSPEPFTPEMDNLPNKVSTSGGSWAPDAPGMPPPAVVDPGPWGQGLKWPGIDRLYQEALWAACACKMAYVSDATALAAFKTSIGADAITYVAKTGIVPSGLRIDYPKDVVFVIQGTTRATQIFAYTNPFSGGKSKMAMVVGGAISLVPPAPLTMDNYRQFAGYYFEPFFNAGKPWADEILAYMNAAGSGKNLYLLGHSLGASVCNVVANLASLSVASVQRSLGSQDGPYEVPAPWQLDTAYAGIRNSSGYVFGQPKTAQLYGLSETTYASGLPPNKFTIFVPCTLTNKIWGVNHPWDPIQLMPPTREQRRFSWCDVVPVCQKDLGVQTRYLDANPDWRNGRYDGGRIRGLGTLEGTRERFDASIAAYHGTEKYINFMMDAAQRYTGQISENWDAFVTSVLGYNVTDTLLSW